ncbi:MAG TPA: hypothetical protein DCW31_05915 [Lactobacillus sp.]|nr:hypothetical protein [Lactobacillus sp.]
MESLIFGLLVGLFSRTQMQAGINCTPIALVLVFVPMLGQMVPRIARFADYLYSGILMKFIYATNGPGYHLNWQDSLVMLAWLVAGSVLFLMAFRRKGLDAA